MIKIFGYEQDSEKLLKLEEMSIECSISELEEIIQFLQVVKTSHEKAIDETEMCTSHYRDWSTTWDRKSADIIVVTKK